MSGGREVNLAWRIDTLDPRGGLAFASFRPPSLTSPFSADGATAFISAPDFQPESVSSRAVALASARGPFQIGLFANEVEVAFDDLASIVEFVRRCYQRGAGGDGTDLGGAALPAPPLEGFPPEFPEMPETDYSDEGFNQFLQQIAEFVELSKKTEYYGNGRAETNSSPWNPNRGGGGPPVPRCGSKAVEILLQAAIALIHEMLNRYPLRGSDDELIQWYSSAQSLGLALLRLNLWPFLLEGPYQAYLLKLVDEMARLSLKARDEDSLQLCNLAGPHPRERLIEILFFLLGCWPPPHLPYSWYRFSGVVTPQQTDAIDDLFRWPVPKQLSHLTGDRNKASANVVGLMTAIQSSPSLIPRIERSSDRRLALAIALLGAAHIVRETEPDALLGSLDILGGGRYQKSTGGPVKLHELQMQSIASGAYAWLVEQMPQLVFSQELEAAIQQTAERSYSD
jgi:hypothetical protein